MSKYKVGDVVIAAISYFDNRKGYYVAQQRRWVVVKIDEDSKNITVSCTGQTHQSKKHDGIKVRQNSKEGIEMQLTMDTFIYCDSTVIFSDEDIDRKKGFCPRIVEILKKVFP